ncbi:MAG: exodeoxyribonuclease VII large subunit [Pontimonas sp.]
MSAATNDSSPEAPWSIQKLSELMGGYIDRLGPVWVEAEITQWGQSAGNIYGKLSDTEADAQVSITIWRRSQERIPEGLHQGDRVIAQIKPSWWVKGGTLSMNVLEMRHTGLGEILEKLEKLKAQLASEGLFDQERKKMLPFLPGVIGLVTGKDSDAEKDVLTNAKLRWPDVEFVVEHAAVQGDKSVAEVMVALQKLEDNPAVEVIIVARGGGDFMNLLPFSDERIVRLVATLTRPVVSAIGHEADRPLLDEVADLRASTPTDAAKRVVPDVEAEKQLLEEARHRLDAKLSALIEAELERLESFRTRPALADPDSLIDRKSEELLQIVARGVDVSSLVIERHQAQLAQLTGSLRGLSPQNTLDRGYAIARNATGQVISRVDQVSSGDALRLRVADGEIDTHVD